MECQENIQIESQRRCQIERNRMWKHLSGYLPRWRSRAVKYSNMFFAFFLFIYVAISCWFTPTSLYLSIIIFARCSLSLFVDLSAQLCQLCENPPFYFNHVGLHWQHIAAWPNHCWHRNSRTNTWNKIDFVFALNVCQSVFCSVGSIKVFDLLLMEGGNYAPLRR